MVSAFNFARLTFVFALSFLFLFLSHFPFLFFLSIFFTSDDIGTVSTRIDISQSPRARGGRRVIFNIYFQYIQLPEEDKKEENKRNPGK
jgi:hypothetical protein